MTSTYTWLTTQGLLPSTRKLGKLKIRMAIYLNNNEKDALLGLNCSVETAKKTLYNAGIRSHIAAKKPFDSEIMQTNTLVGAKKIRTNLPMIEIKGRLVFCDEYKEKKEKRNANTYIKILETQLLPFSNAAHELISPHRKHLQIVRERYPVTKNFLKTALSEELSKFDVSILRKVVDSMLQRIEAAALDAKGGLTRKLFNSLNLSSGSRFLPSVIFNGTIGNNNSYSSLTAY
ncbi:hypothetical protein Glove_236g10 [Diversispora epigaea]|uniref:Uncharacterized protein n=1 Tax=Diversispora epigaea TaxID=1348612 RepID=A0A397IB29_9GLOM|nr:hypothetical protein Glove_236g10 [Diversispora epigaea]